MTSLMISLALAVNQGCVVGEIGHVCRTVFQLLPGGKHETNSRSSAQGSLMTRAQGWSRI